MAKGGRLTDEERAIAKDLLDNVRVAVKGAARGDPTLEWALRRYVYIRLGHDERGNPMQRKLLKLNKMIQQEGKCALCGVKLPRRGAELDRLEQTKGYTEENVRLLCHDCHRAEQEKRGFA